MADDKLALLRSLNFGKRVAEEEVKELASYFVETDQWRRVYSGDVDVIFGQKGAGKSAMYSTLMARESEFFDRGILLISAENPLGTPAFKDLVTDPPTSEDEFLFLWKLYILSLLGSAFVEFDLHTGSAKVIRSALAEADLLPAKDAALRTRLRMVFDFVKKSLRGSAVEPAVKLDPTSGHVVGLSAKISLGEPSGAERERGVRSVDSLLAEAAKALEEATMTVWLLFDRLDVAFLESRDLEANGLRALFHCYLDLLSVEQIRLKVFLRSDIWSAITAAGFREASHITRQLDISWSNDSLLNLVVSRMVKTAGLSEYLSMSTALVLASATKQREFFDALVPGKIDAGKNPLTFEWILGRAQDGTKLVAPREVIHLLSQARDEQVKMLERGEDSPAGLELFSRQAFREALGPVSKVRLQQTIYAEFPELRGWLESLEGAKCEQTPDTLAKLWDCTDDEARVRAQRLIEVGFFEPRGSSASPRYWVPFLYRPGLNLVQGKAS